jgi:hypothetical protein
MSHADHFYIEIILCNIEQIMLFYSQMLKIQIYYIYTS